MPSEISFAAAWASFLILSLAALFVPTAAAVEAVCVNQAKSISDRPYCKPTKGPKMNDDAGQAPQDAISYGENRHSPIEGPANTLKLKLISAAGLGAAPLVLHGFFNLSVDISGRYRGGLPGAIQLVAVSHATGAVYIKNLAREDDLPPLYLGPSAPPAVVRDGPNGPSSAGITESGFFNVDLTRHLGLAGRADVYDVFLWLEDIASELAAAGKPEGVGPGPQGLLYHRASSIVTILRTAASPGLELSAKDQDGERRIAGRAGTNRVSIVALAVESGDIGWTVLKIDAVGGLAFDVKVRDLLPKSGPGDRILVYALTDGRRSPLLDMPARR